jgi:ubiquinone/menaquinone biosynthesis C-methylase UbiE
LGGRHVTDAFEEFEKQGWSGGRAEPYHHGLSAITTRSIDPLLDAAGADAGSRVLDIATGPGYAAARAAERGADAVGVDFSPDMIELAARLHPAPDYRVADANSLPFPDESFDVVVANFLMPHLSDLPAGVAEAARVTRPGGRVALTTWDSAERMRVVGAVMDAVAGTGATPPSELPAGPSIFQYSADREFADLLQGAGLVEPIVERISFTHRVEDLDAFWEDILAGTLRTAVLVTRQSPEKQTEIRTRWAEQIERYRSEGGFDVPCSVKLGSGQKPDGH